MKLRLLKFRTKSVFICLIVVIIALSFISISLLKKQNNNVTVVRTESIVALEKENGTLTTKQTNALNGGAAIKLNGEIYRLNKDGEKRVYVYADENAVVRKYVTIAKNGTYEFSSETDKDYVNKAILSAALTEYLKTADLDGILKDYATDSDVSETLNAALTEYLKSADLNTILKDYATDSDMQAALKTALASYLKTADFNSVLKDYLTDSEILALIKKQTSHLLSLSDFENLCRYRELNKGERLEFASGSVYLVECIDKNYDLTQFKIYGGSKNGSKGKVALVFTGNINAQQPESLIIYQTGSALISDLAGTSAQSTGIEPLDSTCYLAVYELGGMTAGHR